MSSHVDARGAVDRLQARLRLPVIAAPMFLASGPDLVVEACRAGVVGAFPAPNARTIDRLEAWLVEIDRRLTAAEAAGERPGPWAMNMITHSTYGRFDAELDLVRRFRPAIVLTALGGPHRVVDVVHGYGGLVFADVNGPDFARKAADKGADGLILVASGAGGHTGEYSLLAFLDEVRGFWDGPLVAGGAVSTGRAVRAVEMLGADFVNVGTRFLAASESLVVDDYKAMLVAATMKDLVTSRALTGALGSWLRPSLERAGLRLEDLAAGATIDFSTDLTEVKAWKTVWSAGQGVGSIRAVEPIAAIVARLAAEYREAVARERRATRFALATG